MNAFSSQLKAWPKFYANGKEEDFTFGQEYSRKILGIPKHFTSAEINKLDAFNADQVELINAFWQMTNSSKPKQALICSGVNHCGKTHIACGLVNYLDKSDSATSYKDVTDKEGNVKKVAYQTTFTPRYVNEADLLDRITSFRANTNWFEVYTDNCEFLVIDEFGSTQWSPNEARKINQLLNKRFNNGYQTAILTNRKMTEVIALFSSDVKSRFYGCHSVTMTMPVELGNYDTGEEDRDIDWLY